MSVGRLRGERLVNVSRSCLQSSKSLFCPNNLGFKNISKMDRYRERKRDGKTVSSHKYRYRSPSDSPDVQHHKSRHHYRSSTKNRSPSNDDYERHRRRSRSSSSSSSSRRKHKRKKGKQKSRHSSSSSDGASSDDSFEKLKLKRQSLKEEKRKQKEQIKATESVEEKRLRRLAKKEAKERKRKERMGWDEEYMGYTNTDNPFGDAALHKTFVWNKKIEKAGMADVPTTELERQTRLKQKENKEELEKVKKRRLEREREQQAREEEMQQIQRDKEAAQFEEWEKQEDIFHLKQARLRSKIRIQDGRAKPIDLLAKYVGAEEEDLAVEMHEPYTYLTGLTYSDLEDLLEDIRIYVEIENMKNLDFWKDMTIIVEDEMQKLRRIDVTARDHVGDRRDGINSAVSKDLESIFKGKTHGQLVALHEQINKKINSGAEGVDIGYWESLLSQLKAHMAKARLSDRHQQNLRKKLFQLKQEQGVESQPIFPVAVKPEVEDVESLAPPMDDVQQGPSNEGQQKSGSPENSPSSVKNDSEKDEPLITEDNLVKQSEAEYLTGSYSPRLVQLDNLEPGTLITDPDEDVKRLDFARQQLLKTGAVETGLSLEEKAFEREARKGMDDEEAIFSVESTLDQKTYLWSDKYRPRKPRYFNRVHTGFEWNKYNQTHYDMDNPPPKIVQGYKFNIFYPDLIDKNFTPEYFLTPCSDDKDFATLRFHAGPPYEDIAFKIVNREWEFSYKKGFRCQFHNNIFQLWFHFKRYRYRR